MATAPSKESFLLDQLTFYGCYHANKWNQLIHFIFVPTILFSLCVGFAYAGSMGAFVPLDSFMMASAPAWLIR